MLTEGNFYDRKKVCGTHWILRRASDALVMRISTSVMAVIYLSIAEGSRGLDVRWIRGPKLSQGNMERLQQTHHRIGHHHRGQRSAKAAPWPCTLAPKHDKSLGAQPSSTPEYLLASAGDAVVWAFRTLDFVRGNHWRLDCDFLSNDRRR